MDLTKREKAWADGYTTEATLVFEQGEKGLFSKLNRGKIIFLSRDDPDAGMVEIGKRYKCLVKEFRNYGFAQIIEVEK